MLTLRASTFDDNNRGRDIMESNTKEAFSFTTPYFYAGLMIAGNPEYVDCVEASEGNRVDCKGLRICTVDDSMHQGILLDILDGVTIVPNNSVESMITNVQSGVCNVVAAEPLFLLETEAMFGNREWKMGTKTLSMAPLSHVTRQNDTEWSMLANMAVNAFIIAEAQTVPQQLALNVSEIENGRGLAFDSLVLSLIEKFGDAGESLIISEFGDNHGGFNETQIEALVPQGFEYNEVYGEFSSTGLLISYPFGNMNELGPSPVSGSTLDLILKRGYLVCGVIPDRGPWFASPSGSEDIDDWDGFDVDFCKAIAASLFDGDGNKIVFSSMTSDDAPYRALVDGEVDVVAGARVALQTMFQEPTTGESFIFSSPYYYDNESHEAFALMVREDDAQWSDYVFWIVMSTIYAEKEGIQAVNSTEMPVVTLFGELLDPMLSDCISFVGNYAEIYNRSLQKSIPRETGPNMLNNGAGPQLYPIPIM